MIYNNLKRTKKNNNNNIKINSSKESRVLSPSEQSRLFQQQQQETTNLLVHINLSTINKLTDEANLFAETRYPFSPFIIHFPTSKIQEQKVFEELYKFLKENK